VRGFDDAVVADVLDALERERLLSDSRFSEQFVFQRTRRGQGPLKILHELAQRGVDEDTARAHVDPSDPGWVDGARQARAKRFGPVPPGDIRERARQSRFLQQRGFAAEQVRGALAVGDSKEDDD
jgi:regulatory protein